MPFAVALAQREFHLTLTRCRTVALVLLCDLVNRPMLTDSRQKRVLLYGEWVE